jgi:hypothetical protein
VDNNKLDLEETGWGGMDWVDLALDRSRWRALVNAEMNLQFYKMLGNYQVTTQLVGSQAALRSIAPVSW